jgi:hypothetical protein
MDILLLGLIVAVLAVVGPILVFKGGDSPLTAVLLILYIIVGGAVLIYILSQIPVVKAQ